MALSIVGQNRAVSSSLPTVEALDRLWHKVMARPLWAPPTFWRWVKLRWQTRLTRIEGPIDASRVPIGKINDCGACSDSCCIGPRSTVLLRLIDIATLIDVGQTHLISHNKPTFEQGLLKRRLHLRRQTHSMAWRRFPVLAQNAFGACKALTVEGRCGLYPHWPMACARFPMGLNVQDDGSLAGATISYSSRCRSFIIHPSFREKSEAMQVQAAASYNERIKDLVLLAYAPEGLAKIGLLRYLQAS